eukprot:CAMPEP_0170068740 /NCGR_PEP_ID=MMETSP0019_2-20121128/7633_1 /TAXON_ID=98059 /ORGANISM="Dinobryon sp., Strain UTEXLB2267" /LENGTH=182 /DNA_ID=CAMNT_0010276523 /DNA_START=127 /DNA_END=675 /DNA_ORIENTATION=-
MAKTGSLKMGFEDELGVLPPVGYFDPLGLSKGIDAERFLRWRAVEIKHGRVSMLAVTGYVVQESVRFPGYISPSNDLKFSDVPNGIAALGSVPFLGWVQLILFVGWLETAVFKQDPSKAPGDFGTGYFSEFGRVGPLEGDKKVEKLTKELQNGRLAMLAIMELLTHDVAKPAGESLLALHHF